MLKIVVLTSNGIRHKYFANVMNNNFNLVGLITEPKNEYYEKLRKESELIRNHFNKLEEYEKKYLNKYEDFPTRNYRKISKKEINNPENLNWILSLNADYILLYGTGILNDNWCNTFKDRIINLHLGLSPYYRGSATLFWPFANNELEYVGATIHIAVKNVDAGPILDYIFPDLQINDNYYDINYKTIKKAIDLFPIIVKKYNKKELKPKIQDIKKQRYIYRKADFSEAILKKVIEKYNFGLNKDEIDKIKSKYETISS